MKTTLEIPDAIFRRAKARAGQRGVPLRQFVTEAVAEKLKAEAGDGEKTRLRLAGRLRHLRQENAQIRRRIDQEFEQVEPEEWT
jgi:hypothetical protein